MLMRAASLASNFVMGGSGCACAWPEEVRREIITVKMTEQRAAVCARMAFTSPAIGESARKREGQAKVAGRIGGREKTEIESGARPE